MDLEYGDEVEFEEKYVRGSEDRTVVSRNGKDWRTLWKVWRRQAYKGSGLFLGHRWLQEGVRGYDSEAGYYFSAIGRFKVALVSPGYLVNPVYVPLDKIK
jgi:hypothetical protein